MRKKALRPSPERERTIHWPGQTGRAGRDHDGEFAGGRTACPARAASIAAVSIFLSAMFKGTDRGSHLAAKPPGSVLVDDVTRTAHAECAL